MTKCIGCKKECKQGLCEDCELKLNSLEEALDRADIKLDLCFPRLFQIHHQNKQDGTTKMAVQFKAYDDADIKKAIKECKQRHPLPTGCQWLMCNEQSKHFVLAVRKD